MTTTHFHDRADFEGRAESPTIDELVLAAKENDRAAFGQLVKRFGRTVYATALRRLGNSVDAEELAQEVFLVAMQKIGQLETPAAFGGWLRSITHRLAINRCVRRRPLLAAAPDTLEATSEPGQSPLDALLAGERREQVRAGLARLRTMDRDTLEAFYVFDRSLAEMSVEFEAPVGTIKRRLHVARKRLAKELETTCA
ncbi:MAG: RNA polymerase sigma factor [Pirellulales bacterium]